MRILIIEDKEKDIEELKEILLVIQEKRMASFDITTVKKLEKKDLLTINKYDLIFLGIKLKSINGIDLGQKIRKFNNKVKLVIVTHHQQYILEGYKIRADRYFLKPLDQKFFETETDEIFDDLLYNAAGFYDPLLYEKKIYFKNVIYIEFYLKHSKIHLCNGDVLETKKSLKEWFIIVKKYNFAYSHKSFIVNFFHIKKICGKEIIMKNHNVIPLSRHYSKEFKNTYILYLNSQETF